MRAQRRVTGRCLGEDHPCQSRAPRGREQSTGTCSGFQDKALSTDPGILWLGIAMAQGRRPSPIPHTQEPLGPHFLSCDLLSTCFTQHSSAPSGSAPWSSSGLVPGPLQGAVSSRMHSPLPTSLAPITCFEDNP